MVALCSARSDTWSAHSYHLAPWTWRMWQVVLMINRRHAPGTFNQNVPFSCLRRVGSLLVSSSSLLLSKPASTQRQHEDSQPKAPHEMPVKLCDGTATTSWPYKAIVDNEPENLYRTSRNIFEYLANYGRCPPKWRDDDVMLLWAGRLWPTPPTSFSLHFHLVLEVCFLLVQERMKVGVRCEHGNC